MNTPTSDALKALTEIRWDTAQLPTKTIGNIFIRGASHILADSGSDSSRKSQNTGDTDMAVMIGVRISFNASCTHDIVDVMILDTGDIT